jgi:hypothetical protein
MSYLDTIRESRRRPKSANRTNTNASQQQQPQRPQSANTTRTRSKRRQRGRSKELKQPDWVVTALKRRQRGVSPTSREGEILKTYGTLRNTNERSRNINEQQQRHNHKGRRSQGPWDHYGKEEQYERILQLRSKATAQESELRSLRLRLLKSEREKSKAEQGVEKSIGRAAHVMAEALQNAGIPPVTSDTGGNGGIGGGVGSDQRMMGRLRHQIRQLTIELSTKENIIQDMKRTTHYGRTKELQIELDEYRKEIIRLRSIMSTVLRESTSPERRNNKYHIQGGGIPPPPPIQSSTTASSFNINDENDNNNNNDNNNATKTSNRGRVASRALAKRRSRSVNSTQTKKKKKKKKKNSNKPIKPSAPSVDGSSKALSSRRSRLGALAAVVASMLPPGDANAVSFARLLQSLTRELSIVAAGSSETTENQLCSTVSKYKIANAVPQNVVCNYQSCHLY